MKKHTDNQSVDGFVTVSKPSPEPSPKPSPKGKTVTTNPERKGYMEIFCRNCDQVMDDPKPNKFYCSDNCRKQAHRSRKEGPGDE